MPSGELFRQPSRAAAYVDKILKGAKPADIPGRAATKFDWSSLKTPTRWASPSADRCIGRADEVIE